MNTMTKLKWKKESNVYMAHYFYNGITIEAALMPDCTDKTIASEIGTANNDLFGAAFRFPDGRWFHPKIYCVDRVRVHIEAGTNAERAYSNALKEEHEAGERFLEAEKGTPHLRLLIVKAKRGTVMEQKEIGELDMPISLFGGPCEAYSILANEMATEVATKVIHTIRDLIAA